MRRNRKGNYIKLRHVSRELWLSKFHKGSIRKVFNGMSQVFLGRRSSIYSSRRVNFETCKRTRYVKRWKAYFNIFAYGNDYRMFRKELLEKRKMNPLTRVRMDLLASLYKRRMGKNLLPAVVKFNSKLRVGLKEYPTMNSSLYEGRNIFNNNEKWSKGFVGGWRLAYTKRVFGGLLRDNNYYEIPSYMEDRRGWIEAKNKKFYSECIKYGRLPASYNRSLFRYLKEERSRTDPYRQVILERELRKVRIRKSKVRIVYQGGKGLKRKCRRIFRRLHRRGSFFTPLRLLFDYLGSKGLEEVNKKELEKEERFVIPNRDVRKLETNEKIQNPLSYLLRGPKVNKKIWKRVLMKLFYKKVYKDLGKTITEKPKRYRRRKKKRNLLV